MVVVAPSYERGDYLTNCLKTHCDRVVSTELSSVSTVTIILQLTNFFIPSTVYIRCEKGGREGGRGGGDWTIVLIMKVPALIHLEIQHMDRNTKPCSAVQCSANPPPNKVTKRK